LSYFLWDPRSSAAKPHKTASPSPIGHTLFGDGCGVCDGDGLAVCVGDGLGVGDSDGAAEGVACGVEVGAADGVGVGWLSRHVLTSVTTPSKRDSADTNLE